MWTGLVIADFIDTNPGSLGQPGKIYNTTTGLSVTVTGVTESPDGTYAITFAAQTPGDSLAIYIYKTGADFQCILDVPLVITVS